MRKVIRMLFSMVMWTEKNFNFFNILVWIHTKHHMEMTNINFFLSKSFHVSEKSGSI